ncbi:hypothetical protein KM043_010023 [Ampulex compressa]|nr:hypothetical protein KM043_010023 [Ampulex compressa]
MNPGPLARRCLFYPFGLTIRKRESSTRNVVDERFRGLCRSIECHYLLLCSKVQARSRRHYTDLPKAIHLSLLFMTPESPASKDAREGASLLIVEPEVAVVPKVAVEILEKLSAALQEVTFRVDSTLCARRVPTRARELATEMLTELRARSLEGGLMPPAMLI